MIDKLNKLIEPLDVDYCDIRYETRRVDRVVMNKGEVRSIGSNTGDGYVLRVLKDGALARCVLQSGAGELAIRSPWETRNPGATCRAQTHGSASEGRDTVKAR
jgi:predicted Zn-dependent protease